MVPIVQEKVLYVQILSALLHQVQIPTIVISVLRIGLY
jgi:hypothetical protein